MPKQVDREARRRDVVDALFRVVVRDGIQRASLRTVADEARLNIGSVRHYFAGQEELMCFAMRSMLDRVGARLQRRVDALGDLSGLPPERIRDCAVELLSELLPLDDSRRAEVTVLVDFSTAARTHPALDDLAREAATGTRSLVRRILARLDTAGGLRPGLALDTETERLTSLLDGLAFTAVLRPDVLDAATCATVLRAHVDDLGPAAA
ncbi:TetR/AcrR family transcriptional regulator [Streptomyces angustmyceticus]|uniref:TetR family transcriptional regulator n=1 Tax=Streptomyces angustmyceticus TaxID=285578 RepID=A0A5J4LQ44_9ACTN|nr:TetR/AcrR family transcriptional regulator [Streptomyces angustmyceticus]UAL70286.1 TetR/AcrR family transcriptional regulator [Streptomyces angustmyceticus]GES34191.1 TetR family transcriptional regulator [Streptomyces angustmyceticus]GES34682.1 TetR family transcriptional regulator [Streptomyces angustmyceticus]